jgi:peptide/nickel transport system substrate-binding protein
LHRLQPSILIVNQIVNKLYPDPADRRRVLPGPVKAALREFKEHVAVIPLHRQVIPWAARSNVEVVHRADNWFEVQWVRMGKSSN